MNQLQVFNNTEFGQVRTMMISGSPWFVAKDVCECLGITKHRDAVSRLDGDERGSVEVDTLGGTQQMAAVNEYGLYSLVLSSRKPSAKAFKRWITHEVIPAIRKHGAYMTGETLEQALTSPDFLIRLATELKTEQEARRLAEAQIEANKPKVLFADSVAASHGSILVGELAKLLNQNGIDIGQNRLFNWLRENGYLICRKGTDYNMPTQRSMEMQLFSIKETAITHSDGHVSISKTVKVTGKGQLYFVNKFLKGHK
jgi:prophage antirepressor|uniref:Repressor domain protein n=1 Tax=Myoviridae sp. ct31P9 TaxID=2827657 RepID=A0A8S5T319_9CAUD|nr:MAG TPA: repressor domain protein [Myoviridae sp. ct31P9]